MPLTLEKIKRHIKHAQSSAIIINTQIQNLANEEPDYEKCKAYIESNVEHLRTIITNEEIVNSGENIDDLIEAHTAGLAKLAEDIWPV